MSTSSVVEELTTPEQLRSAFPVMSELRPHLTLELYEAMLETMRPAGYRLFAVKEDGRIEGLAGIAFQTNFYYGSYVWVYELVTTETSRSKGHGRALMEHIETLARDAGCDTIALSSGLKRVDAHRFYEDKVGFSKVSYTFSKPLKGEHFMPLPDPKSEAPAQD